MLNVNFDVNIFYAILAFFGVGLVFVVNALKKLMKIESKPAVLLTILVAAVATAITLITYGVFSFLPFIIYTAAVVGEMTGWYKLVWPKKPTLTA